MNIKLNVCEMYCSRGSECIKYIQLVLLWKLYYPVFIHNTLAQAVYNNNNNNNNIIVSFLHVHSLENAK